jgi:hypothetical protein
MRHRWYTPSVGMPQYYLCGQGQCLHRHSCAVFTRTRARRGPLRRIEATEAQINAYPVCRMCCATGSNVCLICGDVLQENEAIECPCPHGHRLCADCTDEHIRRACTERPMDVTSTCDHIGCPCGHDSAFDPRGFSRSQFELWYAAIVAHLSEGRRAVSVSAARFLSELVDDSLTLRCPACGLAFVDFDGCLALECRCGAFFCALCLKHCDGWHHCHAHVRDCVENTRDQSLYLRPSEWEEVQRRLATQRIATHLIDVAQTVSTLFALTLLVQLQPMLQERGIRIALSDVLSFSTIRRDVWRFLVAGVRH